MRRFWVLWSRISRSMLLSSSREKAVRIVIRILTISKLEMLLWRKYSLGSMSFMRSSRSFRKYSRKWTLFIRMKRWFRGNIRRSLISCSSRNSKGNNNNNISSSSQICRNNNNSGINSSSNSSSNFTQINNSSSISRIIIWIKIKISITILIMAIIARLMLNRISKSSSSNFS